MAKHTSDGATSFWATSIPKACGNSRPVGDESGGSNWPVIVFQGGETFLLVVLAIAATWKFVNNEMKSGVTTFKK